MKQDHSDWSRLSARERVRRVHRVLVPPAMRTAIQTIEKMRKGSGRPEWRLRAIARMCAAGEASQDIDQISRGMLDSDRLGDFEETNRAFAWVENYLMDGTIRAESIEVDPLALARQVLNSWHRSMTSYNLRFQDAMNQESK